MCLRSLRCVGLSSTSGVVVDVEVFLPNARGCIVSSTLRERIWWAKRVRLSAARSSGTNMWVRSDGVGRFVWPLLHFVIVGTCSDIVYHCFCSSSLFDICLILYCFESVCVCVFSRSGFFKVQAQIMVANCPYGGSTGTCTQSKIKPVAYNGGCQRLQFSRRCCGKPGVMGCGKNVFVHVIFVVFIECTAV